MKFLRLTKRQRENELLTLFDLGLIVKVLGGLLEIAGSIAVMLVPGTFVVKVAEFVTQGELANDAGDPVATALVNAAQSFSVHSHTLVSLYLFLHGIVKVVLVTAIFAGKKSAYPLFMVALVFFSGYEFYRGLVRHEYLLVAFAVFDAVLFFITAHEYRRIREQAAPQV